VSRCWVVCPPLGNLQVLRTFAGRGSFLRRKGHQAPDPKRAPTLVRERLRSGCGLALDATSRTYGATCIPAPSCAVGRSAPLSFRRVVPPGHRDYQYLARWSTIPCPRAMMAMVLHPSHEPRCAMDRPRESERSAAALCKRLRRGGPTRGCREWLKLPPSKRLALRERELRRRAR